MIEKMHASRGMHAERKRCRLDKMQVFDLILARYMIGCRKHWSIWVFSEYLLETSNDKRTGPLHLHGRISVMSLNHQLTHRSILEQA